MIWLYPRPWRPSRVQVTWRTWRDLHPEPMAGFDMLKVSPPKWWQRVVWFSRHGFGLSVGFGALVVWWR